MELKPDTSAAFDAYVRATETRMDDDLRQDHFLAVDDLPDARRQEAYAQLGRGQIYIRERHTLEDGKSIHVPGGLIHHCVGVVFVPGATLSQTVAVLQDYDNHENIYKPDVRRSKLLERDGNKLRIYLQFYHKSLVTVVLNANFDVVCTEVSGTRSMSASRSTRIVEVANSGKPDEHELPVGQGHGYMWRLDTYWRVEEKDGGVYVQNETIALTRRVPEVVSWLVNPLLRSIPKSVLTNLLNAPAGPLRTRRRAPPRRDQRNSTVGPRVFGLPAVYFRFDAVFQYQTGRTSRRKIRAVTGPMCRNSCDFRESSDGVPAPASSFVRVP